MIVNLSTVMPDGLVCPEGKRRIEYVDKGGTGLYVEVRSTSPGEGTYYWRTRHPETGKTVHYKVGRTTEIDLATAREKVRELRAKQTLGLIAETPKDARSNNTSITLDQAVEQYVFPSLRLRLRSAKKYEAIYKSRILGRLGATPVNAIERHQIIALQGSLVRDDGLAPASANRVIAILRRCLSALVDQGLMERNPASRIAMYTESRTEHYLQAEDLQKLLAVLRSGTKRNFMVRMLAFFLLSTGARLNEALQAQWKDIDRENRVWRIPESNSKSKKVRSVPLNDSSLWVLDQLDTEDKFEWLFRSVTGERLKYVHGAWERLRIKAGLPHTRLHDLRHQHASFLVNSGRTLYEVQAILGHNDPSVTQRYAHLSTKTLQDASDSASAMIQGAMKKSA